MSDEPRPASAQLTAWRSRFGDDYTARNAASAEALDSRRRLWRRVLDAFPQPPQSALEVGANIGLNLKALAELLPEAALYGLEPNPGARQALALSGIVAAPNVLDGAAQAIPLGDGAVDLVFTCGVLIHIAPQDLGAAYAEMHRVARRYLLSIEYFADKPEEVAYRGRAGLLFKRDFGAFWLDNFNDLALLDYGFFWKRATGLDNLTWWLFEKGEAR